MSVMNKPDCKSIKMQSKFSNKNFPKEGIEFLEHTYASRGISLESIDTRIQIMRELLDSRENITFFSDAKVNVDQKKLATLFILEAKFLTENYYI